MMPIADTIDFRFLECTYQKKIERLFGSKLSHKTRTSIVHQSLSFAEGNESETSKPARLSDGLVVR